MRYLLITIIYFLLNSMVSFADETKNQEITDLIEKSRLERHFAPLEALKIAQEALDLAIVQNYYEGQIDAIIILAELNSDLGNFTKSIELIRQLLQNEVVVSDSTKIAHLNQNLAKIYIKSGAFQQALDLLHNTLNFYKRKQYFLEQSKILTLIANSHLENSKKVFSSLDSSLFYYEQALEFNKLKNITSRQAHSIIDLASYWRYRGEVNKSLEYIDSALVIFISISDTNSLIQSYLLQGDCYLDMGANEKAIDTYNQALFLAENVHNISHILTSIKKISDVYALLSIYADKEYGKHKEYYEYAEHAYNFMKRYTLMRDSIFNAYDLKQFSDAQLAAETERSRRFFDEWEITEFQKTQIADQKVQLEKAKEILSNWIFYMVIVIFITFFILFWLFKLNQYKKRNNTLLSTKNLEIEAVNKKLSEKNKIIEESNKNITDSINYAKTIQQAILPTKKEIDEYFKESLLIYQPRDIVSGDFYWFYKISENEAVICLGDCTGHGVPGAFMSMIGSSLLNEIIIEGRTSDPASALDYLDESIKKALKQSTEENIMEVGMDIAICHINRSNSTMIFASAKRPLLVMDKNGLKEIKPTRRSIGGKNRKNAEFENITIHLTSDKRFLITSDGMTDLMNPEREKYGSKRLKAFLLDNYNKDLKTTEALLKSEIKNHLRSEKQLDDIAILGFKV